MTDLQIIRRLVSVAYPMSLIEALKTIAKRRIVVKEVKERSHYAKVRKKKCAKCHQMFPDSRKLIKPYPESNNAYCEVCFPTLRKRRTKKEIQNA